jgi:hypothetical protein
MYDFKVGDRVVFEPDGDTGEIVARDGVSGGHLFRVRWSSGAMTYPRTECLKPVSMLAGNDKEKRQAWSDERYYCGETGGAHEYDYDEVTGITICLKCREVQP